MPERAGPPREGVLLQSLLQQPIPFAETVSGSLHEADQRGSGCRSLKYPSEQEDIAVPCCPVTMSRGKKLLFFWHLAFVGCDMAQPHCWCRQGAGDGAVVP